MIPGDSINRDMPAGMIRPRHRLNANTCCRSVGANKIAESRRRSAASSKAANPVRAAYRNDIPNGGPFVGIANYERRITVVMGRLARMVSNPIRKIKGDVFYSEVVVVACASVAGSNCTVRNGGSKNILLDSEGHYQGGHACALPAYFEDVCVSHQGAGNFIKSGRK